MDYDHIRRVVAGDDAMMMEDALIRRGVMTGTARSAYSPPAPYHDTKIDGGGPVSSHQKRSVVAGSTCVVLFSLLTVVHEEVGAHGARRQVVDAAGPVRHVAEHHHLPHRGHEAVVVGWGG